MKKFISLAISVALAFSLTACSGGVSQEEFDKVNQRLQAVTDGYEYANFEKFNSLAKDNGLKGAKVYVIGKVIEAGWKKDTQYAFVEAEDGTWLVSFCTERYNSELNTDNLLNKRMAFYGEYLGLSQTENKPGIYCNSIVYNGNVYTPFGYITQKNKAPNEADNDDLPNSLDAELPNSASSQSEFPSDTSESQSASDDYSKSEGPSDNSTTSESTAKLTMGQKNALASAKSYLDYTAFSYKGLIKQLEYEQFSHEDAVYAADHCGADWNEQAAKSARSYLEYSSFSRDGLIKQLEYEGFTNEQAVYGVEANGY